MLEAGKLTGIIGIFLPPYSFDGAVECREQSSPDAEIASQHWRSGFDGGNSSDASFTLYVCHQYPISDPHILLLKKRSMGCCEVRTAGEFRNPFTPCHTAPPMAYTTKSSVTPIIFRATD